jgi:hypothetical protein
LPILTNKLRKAIGTDAGRYVGKQTYLGAKRELQGLSEFEGLYSDERELEKAVDKRVRNALIASYKDHWTKVEIDGLVKNAKSKRLASNVEEEE